MNKDERIDELLTDALDGAVSSELTDSLNALELDDELKDAEVARSLLQSVEVEPVPVQFMRRVNHRIRRRSGGQYFNEQKTMGGMWISIDAFVVLAVAVIAACWFFLNQPTMPKIDRVSLPVEVEINRSP